MKALCIVYYLIIGAMSIPMLINADIYSDRLARITNLIANQYDHTSPDVQDMTSAALQALNFVVVENNISKNSPLGRKNKYITLCAQNLQGHVIELLKVAQESENIPAQPKLKEPITKKLWFIESKLKQIEGEIAEIPKKQLLPLSKVQKDLINLLDLLVRKNIILVQRVIRNVGKL